MIYAVTSLGHSTHIINARRTKPMKTKSLTAAQIDTLARHLSEAPITPSVSAKKAGDNLAQLLVAGSAKSARPLLSPRPCRPTPMIRRRPG